MRRLRIFPGARLLPTTNAACARLRLSRKDRRRIHDVLETQETEEQLKKIG